MAQKIKIKYDEKYIENFKKILVAATCVDSPFVKTTQYINEQFDDYNIDDEVRARTISGLLADLSINFMQNSTDAKFSAVSKKLDGAGKEIDELETQASLARSNLNNLKRQMKGLA